jgi:hypothetical protein
MIISNDLKSIYIGSPKTGSRTALSLLRNYGTVLGDHLTLSQSFYEATKKIDNFDYQVVENVYAFWRDPVDKFISAVNFLRGNRPATLLLKNPEWFSQFDYSNSITTTENGFQIIDHTGVTAEMKAAATCITPEQIFESHVNGKINDANKTYMVLEKQSSWIWHGFNTLYYADFDTGMRVVMDSFGVPENTTIPVLNSSESLTTSLSPELEAKVKAYYAEDYQLKPA